MPSYLGHETIRTYKSVKLNTYTCTSDIHGDRRRKKANRGKKNYFRQLRDRKSPCPKSANIHKFTLHAIPHRNARASEGRYRCRCVIELIFARVIWHNNWKKPVGVLQVLFQEYKNLGVLLWNPMKNLLFQPFSCVKFKTSKASVDRSPHEPLTLDQKVKSGFDFRQCLALLSFSKTLYPQCCSPSRCINGNWVSGRDLSFRNLRVPVCFCACNAKVRVWLSAQRFTMHKPRYAVAKLTWHVCAPEEAPSQNAPQGVEKVH